MRLAFRENIRSGILYLFVGGCTALLELALFALFVFCFNWSLTISNIAAVLIATVTNFFLNKNYSFRSSQNFWISALLYAALFLFNLVFSTLVIEFISSAGISPVIAKALTMVCIVIWNYFLYRKVIFRVN